MDAEFQLYTVLAPPKALTLLCCSLKQHIDSSRGDVLYNGNILRDEIENNISLISGDSSFIEVKSTLCRQVCSIWDRIPIQ
jgi:hypothetical protein